MVKYDTAKTLQVARKSVEKADEEKTRLRTKLVTDKALQVARKSVEKADREKTQERT